MNKERDMKLTAAGLKSIIAEEVGKIKRSKAAKPVRRLTAEGLKRVIAQEVQRARKTRRLREMATRSPENLEADLMEMAPGDSLDLETFGGGDFEPGQLTITCVGDNEFTVISRVYGPYDDSLDGDQADPEEVESDPMSASEVADAVGDFSY